MDRGAFGESLTKSIYNCNRAIRGVKWRWEFSATTGFSKLGKFGNLKGSG